MCDRTQDTTGLASRDFPYSSPTVGLMSEVLWVRVPWKPCPVTFLRIQQMLFWMLFCMLMVHFFVIFKDSHMAIGAIQCFHKKTVFDGCGRVDGLSSETQKVLAQLKPQLFGMVGKSIAPSGNETPAGGAKSSLKLSDVLEAIAGWSFKQKQQLVGGCFGFPTFGCGN